jgi:hypothetical protein
MFSLNRTPNRKTENRIAWFAFVRHVDRSTLSVNRTYTTPKKPNRKNRLHRMPRPSRHDLNAGMYGAGANRGIEDAGELNRTAERSLTAAADQGWLARQRSPPQSE